MNECAVHLAEIELALISSSVVVKFQIVRARANTDDGYIRVRATLINGDFLEAVEYFVLRQGQPITVDYRHQWMDATKQTLRKRWDSAPDHPHFSNFPHHVHVGDEKTVVSGHPIGVIELLMVIEQELSPFEGLFAQ